MIKIFTLNKNNKIELTKEELQKLLDESYWEGYRSGSNTNWIYSTPTFSNPYITCTTTSTSNTITMDGEN